MSSISFLSNSPSSNNDVVTIFGNKIKNGVALFPLAQFPLAQIPLAQFPLAQFPLPRLDRANAELLETTRFGSPLHSGSHMIGHFHSPKWFIVYYSL